MAEKHINELLDEYVNRIMTINSVDPVKARRLLKSIDNQTGPAYAKALAQKKIQEGEA